MRHACREIIISLFTIGPGSMNAPGWLKVLATNGCEFGARTTGLVATEKAPNGMMPYRS
jgi:hypothetical protein